MKVTFKKLFAHCNSTYVYPVLLFIIAFLIRLPLLHTEFIRTVDSIEYINVANNFASGQGFIATIKPYLFNNYPVIISGNLLRPMFTSVVYALLLKMYNNYFFLQFFNLFLGSVNVVLLYYLARKFLHKKMAFFASLLIACNPNLIIESRFIISEQLFYFLTITFFLFYYYLADSSKKYMLLGALAALSFLTRSEGGILIIILIIYNYRKYQYCVLSVLFFFLVCLPNFILNYYAVGDPFYSPYAYQLRVLSYIETENQFYHYLPSPLTFIAQNYMAILHQIGKISIGSITSLFGIRFLGLLSIFFLIGLVKIKNIRFLTLLPLILFTIFLYLTETFTWAVAYQPERHLALVFYFLVVLLFIFINTYTRWKLLYVIYGITIVMYLIFDFHQLIWIRANSNYMQLDDKANAWIRKNTKADAIISAHDSDTTYFFTNRPAIKLPNDFPLKTHNIKEFKQYLTIYSVAYIKVDPNEQYLYHYLTKVGFIKKYNNGYNAVFCAKKCEY